ncbi:hypothetical protein LSH36_76g00070 [Paralvinella palmiformis]|uniref:Ubiquitin carboxyl-terminal hydrolase MINDY n=1 Tax=Paralvinella palmiformis TaxID=53620 RepID=A0AAD9K2B5_9ANNE|nr:hypothetical protein LSH36_76g00070 [Paralvinella palmiformis]
MRRFEMDGSIGVILALYSVILPRRVHGVREDMDEPTLKGIQCRSDIGFLSLFEHYKSCQVGTYLKTPKYAIWVIYSESHFSVLFSLKLDLLNDWKAEQKDLSLIIMLDWPNKTRNLD